MVSGSSWYNHTMLFATPLCALITADISQGRILEAFPTLRILGRFFGPLTGVLLTSSGPWSYYTSFYQQFKPRKQRHDLTFLPALIVGRQDALRFLMPETKPYCDLKLEIGYIDKVRFAGASLGTEHKMKQQHCQDYRFIRILDQSRDLRNKKGVISMHYAIITA